MRFSQRISIYLISILLFLTVGRLDAQFFIEAPNHIPDATNNMLTKEVKAVDIDGDGDLDIILANEFQQNAILLNNGLGVFSIAQIGIPANEEHDSEDIIVSDFNQDGWLDLIFVSEDDFEHEYYFNNGSGNFSDSFLFLPFTTCRAAVAHDFSGDGIVDLMLGNKGQNLMLINDGSGNFINDTPNRIPFLDDSTFDLKISDVDNDGDIDIFVANEDGNRLLINNGSNIYLDETEGRLPSGILMDTRAMQFQDIDNDGDEDIFLCNVAFAIDANATNRLLVNNGQGVFSDVTGTNLPAYTEQSVHASFVDLDFDGDADLIYSNVLDIPMRAFLNNGSGKFDDHSYSIFGGDLVVESFGFVTADFDGDGVKDLYISNREGKDKLLIRDPDVILSTDLVFENTLEIWPNPTSATLYIRHPNDEGSGDVSILDTQGQRVIHQTLDILPGDLIKIDLPAHLSNGVYTISLVNGKKLYNNKFVLLR